MINFHHRRLEIYLHMPSLKCYLEYMREFVELKRS